MKIDLTLVANELRPGPVALTRQGPPVPISANLLLHRFCRGDEMDAMHLMADGAGGFTVWEADSATGQMAKTQEGHLSDHPQARCEATGYPYEGECCACTGCSRP